MSTLITLIPGTLMVILLVGFIYKRDAIHWQYLEQSYGSQLKEPLAEKLGHLALYGKFPVSKSYNGIVKVGACRNGISLRIFFPIISYFCKPMFIPYEDIKGWKQNWFLNADSVELELAKAPEVKLLMPKEQLQWIADKSGQSVDITSVMSPHKDKPLFWYYFIIVTGVFIPLSLGAVFLLKLLGYFG